jgi:hypothetical protein
MKSIAFTTALALSFAASHVNLRSLIITTFTGPGRYSRIAALAIILANLKNVPFAWHVSILFLLAFLSYLPEAYILLVPRLQRNPQTLHL